MGKFVSGVSGHILGLNVQCLGVVGDGQYFPQTINSAFRQFTWRISMGLNTGYTLCASQNVGGCHFSPSLLTVCPPDATPVHQAIAQQ